MPRIMRRLPTGLIVALASAACSDPSEHGPEVDGSQGRVASTRGSAVVMSRDEKVAVASNRMAGTVTVLRLDPSEAPADIVTDSRELDCGSGSEPVAAVIGADDDTAYVLLRGSEAVQKITGLHGRSPSLGDSI